MEIGKKIMSELKCETLINESMSKHTSFKIGGKADALTLPKDETELQALLKLCQGENIPYFVMGNGTNLLVSDEGYRGVIIKIYKNFSGIRLEKNMTSKNEGTPAKALMHVKAGTLLAEASKKAAAESLSGLEFACGIPGTFGGAVCMNAGAYGADIKGVLHSVRTLDCNEFKNISTEEAGLEYRSSNILRNKAIVLEATISLNVGNEAAIREEMRSLTAKRNEKQPVSMPSAGSTFKRPEGFFAGKLIEDAGLRGKSFGGAKVSEKHCGFIINYNNASCSDVLKLIDIVKETVYEKFGVMLETEIRFLGCP